MKKLTSILLMLFFALSGLFAANMKGGEVFYLTPHTTWNSDNARYAIYFFNNSTNKNTWVSMSKVEGESNLWTGIAPAGDWANLIFCRMNPSASSNGWGDGVFWGGQTQDLTWDGTNNWFTVDSSKDAWNKPAGTWSTYASQTPDPEPEDPDQPVEPEDPDTPVDPEDPDTPVVPDPEEPAYTAVFICGEFNEWGENYELTTTDGDYYVLEATFDLTGEFKIASSDWSTINYGGSYTISAGTEQILTKGSNDNMIADGTIAVAKVEFTVSTGTLLITAAQTPDPEDPDQPVDPEDPDQPVDPEDPDQPVDPEDPDTPVVPDSEEPAGITFTVQVPEGTIECYVTGDPLWNTGDFLQMEKVEGEDNLFTITTTALKGTAWKYCSGPGWAYVEKDAQGNEILDRTAAGNPDVVAKWALLYEPDAEPIEPYYAIRGLVSWDMADDIKLTANAEGTEYSITGLDIAADKEFKVIYVDENVNITWYGVSALEANPEITQTGVDNIILAAGKYDIYFKTATKTMWIGLTSVDDPDQPVDPEDPDQPVDPEDPDQPVDPEDPDQPVDPEEPAAITFTVQVPEGTIECYITGADLWNTGEFLQMEKVEGEDNLFTITTTALKGTQWKYASGPSWDYVEKGANGEEVANRTEAGNPDVVASWLAVYDPEGEPTAVDEAEALSIYAAEGTIYADAEIAIYTLAGVDVTAMNGSLYGTYIVKAENGATLINVW